MTFNIEATLRQKLEERKAAGNIRMLSTRPSMVDFVSNDYLGLARNTELFERINQRISKEKLLTNGSGGSRLLAGNHSLTEQLERRLAAIFNSEAALVFNSGYNANLALISSVADKGDTIIYDQLAHICLKEGAWLSKATSFKFMHNDCKDLEDKLKLATGNIFIITESVFSMDGDFTPIEEIIHLSKKYGANIIVDEAHSTGCYGSIGNGWLCEKELEDEIFARVYTFGKGIGVHGACVAGSQTLIDFLINFGRPFIYTTALPLQSILAIDEAFLFIEKHRELPQELNVRIALYKRLVKDSFNYPTSDSAIQPVIISGNEKVISVAKQLNEYGFDVRPILSPTVKSGEERLRISLHAFNTDEEITQLVNSLANFL